ncbi:MAG: hypothetical protein M5U31_07660 [Acidimicrobiia bacterium]|nr:hypothetical protein [Acidimicrobiia bacterium]
MRRLAVLTVGAALLLAACSSGDGTASDGSSTSGSDPSETTSGDTTTTIEADAGDCPVGTWRWSGEEFQRFWDVIASESGGEFTATGDITVEFRADGTFTWTVDYSITIAAGGAAGPTTTLKGDLTGSYTTDDGVLATENLENMIEATSSVPGVDPSALGDQLLIENFPLNESPFHCEDGNLVIEAATVNSRTPVTLIPV